MLTKRRAEFCVFAALLGLVIWFCDEMIFFGKIPIFRDLTTYFYPIKFSVADSFKSGALPLWDRHMAGGFPIMAGLQSAVFYPPSIVFYLFSFSAAIQATFVLHYLIAASGGFWLFRSWRNPVPMAFMGAILFTFAGTMVSLTNLLNHFQSAVWLPWAIYFWERAVTTRAWKNFVVFSVVALCQLLGGSPEIFALTLGLLVLDLIRLVREREIASLLPALAMLIGSVLMVICLGMVQLLPTAELVSLSRRDQPIPMSEALAWSLRPSSLLGILLPTLEADPTLSVGIRLLFAHNVPFLLSHYMGVITVFAFACWCCTADINEVVFVSVLIGMSLVLAFGNFTPVYPFVYEWLPPMRVLRFPEKYYFLTFALLVFVAIRGLRQLDNRKDANFPWVVATVIFSFWIGVYFTFWVKPQLLADWLQASYANESVTPSNPTTIAAILVLLEKQVAVSLVLLTLLCGYRLGFIRQNLMHVLLAGSVFFDLSSATKPLHFLRDATLIENAPRIFQRPPIENNRLFYFPPGENLHPSYVRVAGQPDHAKATEIALNNLLPNAGMLYGFDYFQDIDALGRRSYTDFLHFINGLPAEQRGRLLAAVNVKYVVAFHPLEVKGLELVQEFPEHYSRLYEVAGSLPRAYVVGQARYERDPKSTLSRLASDSFDPRREVIVDSSFEFASKGDLKQNAAIGRYENNHVEVEAKLDQPGILVLTDAFYPGWKVRVDGTEQKILRANYFFRGVELSAGSHKVQFSYEPESFRIGLLISLTTIGVIAIVPLIGWIRRRVGTINKAAEVCGQPLSLGSE